MLHDKKYLWKDRPFKVEGLWFPSFDENKKVYGKLSYEPENGAFLSLYFEGKNYWHSNIVYHGSGSRLGHTHSYTCLKLEYDFGGPRSRGIDTDLSRDITVRHYRVGLVLSGFHLPDYETEEPENITEMSFSLKNLNSFIESSGFSFEREKDSFRVSYRGDEGSWERLTGGFEYRISKDAFAPHEVEDFGIVETQEYVQFKIRAVGKGAKKLSDFTRFLEPVSDFFSLASHDLASPFHVFIKGDFEYKDSKEHFAGTKVGGGLYFSDIRRSDVWFEARKEYFVFCEEDLEEPLGVYLGRWLGKYKKIFTPFSLYKSAVYQKNFAESYLLLLAQAVEVYHREMVGGTYMDQNRYNSEIIPQMNASIPDSLADDHKSSLKAKIRFGNEYALWKRVKLLIAQNRDILEHYIPIENHLARDITNARNFFTHYSGASAYPSSDRLNFYITILKALFEISLVRELGFSGEKVKELIHGCESYRYIEYNAPWSLRHEKEEKSEEARKQ